jgi:tetratricopeptide (TPR) repeat protein
LIWEGSTMVQENVRLAELSRTIDARELGRRIRNARVAAGLTQTALAGGEVTAAYLSRIEDGQRRPEFGLLGRLAQRMGVSLEFLVAEGPSEERMALELSIDHAELALVGGNAAEALRTVETLMAGIGRDAGADELRRRVLVLRAGALEATGDLNGAILQLEDLTRTPEASVVWLRSLISLSRCYQEVGELDRAIAVGENAAETIESLGLEGLTESIQLSVTVAGAYMRRGDLDRAMRICRRAMERADSVGSPIAKASAYWNASLVESRKGASQIALDLAQKALAQFEVGEDARNLARLRGHVADMQLQMDPPDASGAIETLELAARELEWSAASPADRASQLQTRARAHLFLGEHESARADIQASLEVVPADAYSEQAYGLAVLGEVEMHAGNTAAAREALLGAARMLTAVGADREVAQLWFELATHLRKVGEIEAALDAFERAATSTGLRASTPQESFAVDQD